MSQSSPFDFKPSGKTNSPSRIRSAAAAKQSPLIQLTVIGAWICLVYAPLSPNWFAPFTVGNTLLNLISVVPFALIPLAVLWRIRNEAPLSPTQQYVGCAAVGIAVILTLAIWFGTGFLGSANWHTWWCSFLGRCAVAAVILWFPQFSTKTPLPLVVVGGFALLMIVSFMMRGWALTMPNVIWSGYAGFKTVLILISLIEKLLITSVVAGFIATRWGQSPVTASGSLATPDQGQPESGADTFLTSLTKSAGAAAKLVARQTERTKLTTLTLPTAYRALGKDCIQQKRHLHCVPELMEQLRSVMGELKTLTEAAKAQPSAQSITDKAKAAGKQAADLARQKQLGMKRDSLLGEAGKAIYGLHCDASGPTELVAPIRDAVNRVTELDSDIARLSDVGKGSLLTPNRLVIGGGVAAVLLVGVMVVMAGSWLFGGKSRTTGGGSNVAEGERTKNNSSGSSKGFAQKVLDADPALFTGTNVCTHNEAKEFTPKHPAGTKADAIQAMAMLTPGSVGKFIRHNEGLSAFVGLRCNLTLWKSVFGSPENLRTNIHNKHEWLIRCSDGDLRCVGDILGNRYFGVDVVFIE